MPNEDGLYTKEEFDAGNVAAGVEANTAKDAAIKEAEDARLEVFTEDYASFLKAKEAKAEESKAGSKKPPEGETDWDKLSKQDIFNRATAETEAKINKRLDDFQANETAKKDDVNKREVVKFANDHKADYEQIRPVMYGLSLEAKHANSSLQELYDAAKTRVGEIAGVTDEQKRRSRNTGGERPGASNSSSQTRDKKYTASEAANEAWEEQVGADGLGSI